MISAPIPEPERILIRANNWIGDVVMISPSVRAVRRRYPKARIAILAKSWVLDTLRDNAEYDELIEYDREGPHRGVRGRLRLIAELRRGRFDLALLFQKAFEAAALAWLAGIPIRVGYATDHRSVLLTHALPLPRAGTHHAAVFAGLARAIGCDVQDLAPSFQVGEAARARARALLQASGWDGSRSLVALHPGASKEPRAWHADRFAELGVRLARGTGVQIVLLGGPGDRQALDRIAMAMPAGSLIVPRGVASIKEMGGVLERCSLFVGNDSGPMHVAAALGVPTLSIFGPGSPALTAPLAPAGKLITIDRRYPCSPCRQNFFRECAPAPSGKPFCLEEIPADEVEAAARRLLSGA